MDWRSGQRGRTALECSRYCHEAQPHAASSAAGNAAGVGAKLMQTAIVSLSNLPAHLATVRAVTGHEHRERPLDVCPMLGR